jgi:hypothetical protein
MKFLTYDEWKELGFHVVKGEKSQKRNENGKCVFSSRQVEENEDDNELYEYVSPSDLY